LAARTLVAANPIAAATIAAHTRNEPSLTPVL
jgi:hypothetical protein